MLAACLALLALVPAASPVRARAVILSGTPRTAEFKLGGSHRYRIAVSGSRGRVLLSAGHRHAIAYYAVRGRTGGDRLRARFGSLGRVSVAFRERRVQRVPSGSLGCTGGAEVVRHGIFVGAISFRGEHGYTRVRARAARGEITVRPRWRCSHVSPGEPRAADQVELVASCGGSGLSVVGHRSIDQGPRVFPDEDTSTAFFAASNEHRGAMRIARLALVTAGRSAFLYDEAFTQATVRPPPPFHGVGALARDAAGVGSWSGSLSVDLPGRRLDLIDPRYAVGLYRHREGRLDGSYVLPPRSPCPASRASASVAFDRRPTSIPWARERAGRH